MWSFREKAPKWIALLPGDNNYGRQGGQGGISKSSSIELLPLDYETTQERSNSFSSAWKPVWYTGWHTGVLAWAAFTMIVLFINVGLTIYAATNPRYKMEGGIGTLYNGSCDKSKAIALWLHLGINTISTLLLSGSNYTQQCLASPTRSEIDTAHARRRWMDIGVPSIRNLFRIEWERALLWIAIGFTSIPLHLLYNSAVYTSLAANDFEVVIVTKGYFQRGDFSNMTEAQVKNNITGEKPGDNGYQPGLNGNLLFESMLKGYNPSRERYEDLTPANCTKLYNTDFVSSWGNLFLISKNSSSSRDSKGILSHDTVYSSSPSSSHWMCAFNKSDEVQVREDRVPICNPNKLVADVASGHPWLVTTSYGEAVEISGCLSEKRQENCKVQFLLEIMIVVICCNLVKACCMSMAVVRSREPTLVTLGDAVDSFLRIPDSTTVGMCFADRQFIVWEWKYGRRIRPGDSEQWKQKGVKRWWTCVSKTRWITCNFFCLVTIGVAAKLLRLGMKNDGIVLSTDLKSMWSRGFGKVNSVSILTIPFPNITQAILLVNLPQTILSFLYLTYNSLFTTMLMGHEWSLFSHRHRTLRVTSPRPGQRSTYWLQIPYTYAIPLMTLSGLLHWLTSQSIFLARVEISDSGGMKKSETRNNVGYSCIAIIFVLALGILALLSAVGMGYKPFAAEITCVGSCSAAISASCHVLGEDSEQIVRKEVRWGDVGITLNTGVRHLAFSSKEGVRKPVFGEAYAGMGERRIDH